MAECGADTLDTALWAVDSDVPLDCSDIPTCSMTCGPNEELLLASARNCGCMAEWWVHSNWLRLALAAAVFILMNVSRLFLVRGL
ncbi:unnamed protein product, partial [Phaeothamnion confervicola]